VRAILGFLLVLFSAWANSQAFPNKPVKIIVGFPPGGSGDFLTRLMSDEMGKDLGVPVVAENRPGAGGNIANEIAAKAPADGYTVLNATHFAVNKALYKSIAYDADRDFVAVSRIATGATVICLNNNVPIKDLKELIAHAKANPGKLFNASAGYGSAPHLASVLFETVAGVKFTSIQYKGGGPAAQAVLAGDAQVVFATSPTVMGFVKAGRMRALAVSRPLASPAIAGVPGAQEAGLPGFEYNFWFGLFVPAGTPPAAIKRLHEAAARALAKPDVRDKIALQGMDATPSASPDAFAAEVKAEVPFWEKLVRDSGAKVE